MVAVGKGVLGVKLELVDLPDCQQVDQFAAASAWWALVAADIEHDAAIREVGPIAAVQIRQRCAMLLKKLAQRLDGVESPRGLFCHNIDALRGDGHRVALRVTHTTGHNHQRQAYLVSGNASASRDFPAYARSLIERVL